MAIVLKAQPGPQENFLATSADICIYGGSAGGGKAMKMSEPILTPHGFVPMREIKVGWRVIGRSGKPATVIQIHPQGVQQLYKIRFSDGAETECTAEHLWLAKEARSKTKCTHRDEFKIYDTATLMDRINSGKHYLIPLCEPVHFNCGYLKKKIKPYTLGAIVGDGSMTTSPVTICNPDAEVIENIKNDGYTLKEYKHSGCPTYGFSDFKDEYLWLGENNLTCKSERKYIPKAYMLATVDDRLSLVQGLFDTDGYADKRGHVEYSTVSEQLAKDVQWLIRSLGGKATISEKDGKYRRNGELKAGQRAYTVYVQTKNNALLFRLSRKKERCIGKKYNGGFSDLNRRIVSVEPSGKEECQCITIDEPDGLYVARDFIVTHNSFALLLQALRYKNVPTYGCTILRKNFNQIFSQGGLWDESEKMYRQIPGAVGTASKGQWVFTDNKGNQVSRINFAHIERDEDVFKFQGSQIPAICCEKNTPVLMENGEYKKICDIKQGDRVQTLNGGATVNRVYPTKLDECVEVELEDGQKQIHNVSHKILTREGWISYEDIIHPLQDNSQENVLLHDVVVHIPKSSSLCDKGKAHKDNHFRGLRYNHPYTGRSILAEEACVSYETIKITPIGKRFVVPIEVEHYNHYLTKTGIVNRNCFDELTHFSEKTFFYMLSRNRSTCGVKPYVRATCNPDADSWVAAFIEWWIDQESGYPIKERSGVIRWFIRRDGIIYWADTREELWEQFDLKTEEEKAEPKSVTFIASSVYDNKELLRVNPQYLANLKALPIIEKERLLYGNWKIKSAAGLYFKREQVGSYLPAPPSDIIKYVRCWDLAATSENENGEAAYTAGVLMGKRRNGTYVVIDVINRQLNANDVRQLVKHTAQQDRARYKRVTVRLPQDPGQAGKEQAQSYIKFLAGFNAKAVSETGSKEARAEPMAAQWQAGNFDLVVAPWNEPYLVQLESFPESKWKDMVDASANAFAEIESGAHFNLANLV